MLTLIRWFLDVIPSCRHRRETFPQRRRKSNEVSRRVCLDCGRERRYALLDLSPIVPMNTTRQAC